MISLTENESKVLKFIKEFWGQHRNAPIVNEIAELLEMEPTLVRVTLEQLNRKCYIELRPVMHRSVIVPMCWE